jgi:hypothetical protein
MALDDVAGRAGSPTGALDDAQKVALLRREGHADPLARAPLRRAVRSALEVADCVHQARDLLASLQQQLRRDRNALALVDAAALELMDAAAETDEIGQALIQLEIVGAGS